MTIEQYNQAVKLNREQAAVRELGADILNMREFQRLEDRHKRMIVAALDDVTRTLRDEFEAL